MTNHQRSLILVVDDDAMNREVMEAFLTSEDYDVSLANTGQLALDLVINLQPDLILLDVRMPDINGFEVCRQIKSHPETTAIPIIIVTGFDSPRDREQSTLSGANDFLARPFSGETLIKRVQRFVKSST